ncbi:nuclease-related domain-containing protein [Cryobacterium sp. 10I1]|uniref:nuclease-related domain-containing protein n=1 Tax=unclassified Cryobacterium TaxID=2649013 RepID=UPI002B22F9F4|nr:MULTISPECIES: nuclease-related domain-containing protein [unclassified Cryobacterium]MEB0203179.1 nuclease-related domain-containing protein [Cryobacterium sp. 5I3]MEB0304074.1 nuclease-related domain-containing protein [Cryobacterium sp. 10I1]
MESQGGGNQAADQTAAEQTTARPHTPGVGRRAAPRVIRDLRGNVPGQGLMIEVLRRQAESGEIVPETGAVLLTDAAVPWRIGALGEIQVGAHLAQLGPEWTVLHSVPVGKGESDIDHVVISQAGVFTINTKRHAGQKIWVAGRGFMVGNHKQPYIRKASHEAKRAEKMLSLATGMTVPVCGVIALVDPASITRKAPPEGDGVELRIIDSRDLCATVSGRPVFSVEQIAVIVAAAAQPGTWHAGPHSIEEPAEIAAAFHALSDRVVDEATPPVILRPRTTSSPATTRTRQPSVGKPRAARPSKRAQKAKEKRQAEIIKLIAVCVGLIIWYFSTH